MNMHGISTDLFERQFQKWDDSGLQNQTVGKDDNLPKTWQHPVITLSSEPGCDLHILTRMLARGFGLDLFDREIVDLVAENANQSKKMIETLDDKTRSALDDWLAEEIFDDEFTAKKYLPNLRAVIFTIAARGNAVIIGRGAEFLIQPEDRLALRLIAPLEQRITQVMRDLNLSEKKSLEYIDRITQQRHSFIKKYFHADIDNPVNYNLVINTAFFKPKAVFEIVKIILNRRERS